MIVEQKLKLVTVASSICKSEKIKSPEKNTDNSMTNIKPYLLSSGPCPQAEPSNSLHCLQDQWTNINHEVFVLFGGEGGWGAC